jgi:CelD/BcsL family acetyltransferase involved in cellulose biosynthesis
LHNSTSTQPLPCQKTLGALNIRVSTDTEGILREWGALEASGLFTYFQSRAWCLSWLEDVGTTARASAVFVLGTWADGTPVFLLPLQVRSKRGFRLLEFLTVPHASYGFGLYDKHFLETEASDWFAAHFSALLQILPAHDAVYFRDMPERMLGYHNPLHGLARFKGANPAFMMGLTPDFQGLLASKRSTETLRSMRKRDKRLADSGSLHFGAPETGDERVHVIGKMFADQEKRLAQTGVRDVYGDVDRRFLIGLSDPNLHGKSALIPYRLTLDGTPICVLLGGRACGVFWAMITSLADGEWRKHSPGDYTLRHVIAQQCTDGVQYFDFALGYSDYKLAWADTEIETSLIIQASSLKGLVLALTLGLKHTMKRLLKRQAVLRDVTFALRRITFGKKL